MVVVLTRAAAGLNQIPDKAAHLEAAAVAVVWIQVAGKT
jgi:hypothetical protein